MRDEVKEGYEKGDYEGEYRKGRELQQKEIEFFESLFEGLSGDKVLDLGCGTGVPFDRYLTERGYDVLGVDIAQNHVERARENVPNAKFLQGDFFSQDFDENSFDAIVSFYAIFHIPREEHSKLFQKMHHWVTDDGIILITLGAEEMDNEKGELGGADMYWSSYTREESLELLEEAGFTVKETYVEDWRDTEETHFWVLAEA